MNPAKLSTSELELLQKLESVIEKARKYRLLEAKALLRIRNKRLYRTTHRRFEDYCRERWGVGLAHGKRLCDWAEVAKNLAPKGAVPQKESHARPLAALTPQQQRRVWSHYIRTHQGVHSALSIQRACREVLEPAISQEAQHPDHEPLMSPISWFGSKAMLARRIVPLLPPHTTYIEPFSGSAAVLFRKPPSEVEIINDVDQDIVNLFRVLRDPVQGQQLQELLKNTPYSRNEHDWCRANPTANDPVEQARRFFVRCRQSFSGAVDDAWAYGFKENRAADFVKPVDQLHLMAERLRKVQIEDMDFRQLLAKCDRHGVVVYADPPYLASGRNTTDPYDHDMAPDDHLDLLEIVKGFRFAKVVLSGFRSRLYDQHLRGWRRVDIPVAVNCSAAASDGHRKLRKVECLWLNY